jgi:hypothetical protein
VNEAQLREALRRRPSLRRALEQRLEVEQGAVRQRLLGYLFEIQRGFVDSPAKRKAAVCSRRAGKTFGLAAWLYDDALATPGGLSVYITGARPQARRNLMPALERLNLDLKLGMRQRTIDGQLICELPNRHQIWIAGCDNRAECEKFRGAGRGYTRAVIDEAGSGSLPGYLPYLVDEILDPALLDQQGDLALTGTPGLVCAGLFYTATTGDGGQKWDTHHWTLLDNPHLPDPTEFLESKKREMGWTDDNPTYRREYLGQWVKDNSVLAIPVDWQRNVIAGLPDSADFDGRRWDYVLGIDVGVAEAPSAFVVLATARGLPDMYCVEAFKKPGLIPTALAVEVKKLEEKYGGFNAIVVDTGGLGAGYAAEMVQSHGIRCEAAKKADKRMAIEVVRGEVLSGNLRFIARECSELWDELTVLPLDEKGLNFDAAHFDCHAADALVYAVRKLRPLYNEREEHKAPTADEYNRQRMAEHKAQAARTAIANATREAKRHRRFGF